MWLGLLRLVLATSHFKDQTYCDEYAVDNVSSRELEMNRIEINHIRKRAYVRFISPKYQSLVVYRLVHAPVIYPTD